MLEALRARKRGKGDPEELAEGWQGRRAGPGEVGRWSHSRTGGCGRQLTLDMYVRRPSDTEVRRGQRHTDGGSESHTTGKRSQGRQVRGEELSSRTAARGAAVCGRHAESSSVGWAATH